MDKTCSNFMYDLNPHYGLISVSGADSLSFLQGQLTCDVTELPQHPGLLGAFCNPKGRIRALFRLFLHDHRYYLYLPLHIIPQTLEKLHQYAKFSKVLLQDESHLWTAWGISGPDAQTLIQPFTADTSIHSLAISNTVARSILLAPKSILMPHIEKMQTLLTLSDFETWKGLDIENLIPEIWQETVERFLPHDIQLVDLGAVSFKKGCYCGQEIIARMEYRGKTKKHLRKEIIKDYDTIPAPGSEWGKDIVVTTSRAENTLMLLLQTQG